LSVATAIRRASTAGALLLERAALLVEQPQCLVVRAAVTPADLPVRHRHAHFAVKALSVRLCADLTDARLSIR
jgi:hypothetical protein